MKLIICYEIDDEKKAQLRAAAGDAECIFTDASHITDEMVSDADAVIGNVPPALLSTAENLSWVQLTTSGADAYVKQGVLPDNTVLTCATGAYGVGIAEYMVAMLLMMMKKLPAYMENHRRGVWHDEGAVVSPMGKRALIVGAGDIGCRFAQRLRPFGCRISGIRRRADICPAEFDEMHSMDELKRELEAADIIALCLPKTDETHHLMSAAMLRLCKSGAYLMNVGRGDAVDCEALLCPENTAHFGGIWLDVCEREPLPAGDPLFSVPNVIITPHITGGFHLDITAENVFRICLENLKAWRGGGELRCIVDRSTGYAK
jgi:phosphoglycerate dehydrogenase-like enzyme